MHFHISYMYQLTLVKLLYLPVYNVFFPLILTQILTATFYIIIHSLIQ